MKEENRITKRCVEIRRTTYTWNTEIPGTGGDFCLGGEQREGETGV
jgi:hypothetical protein